MVRRSDVAVADPEDANVEAQQESGGQEHGGQADEKNYFDEWHTERDFRVRVLGLAISSYNGSGFSSVHEGISPEERVVQIARAYWDKFVDTTPRVTAEVPEFDPATLTQQD